MTVTGLLMQNLAQKVTGKETRDSVKTNTRADDFEKKLNAAKSDSEERVSKTERKQRPEKQGSELKHKPAQIKDRDSQDPEITKAEDETAAEDKAVNSADKTEELSQKAEKDGESLDTKILKRLSNELGIPEDELAALLASMNIRPSDLGEPDKLADFVLKISGKDKHAELLTEPGVSKLLNDIQDVLDEFTAKRGPIKFELKLPDLPLKEFAPIISEGLLKEVPPEPGEPVYTLPVQPKPVVTFEASAEVKTAEAPAAAENTVQTAAQTDGSELKQSDEQSTDSKLPFADINPVITQNTEQKIQSSAIRKEAAKSVNTQDVIDQIVSKIKVDIKSNISEVKILLKPEHLGDVTMKVATENGIVTAQFVAESQRVKEAIEAGLQNLRDTLTRQGVNVADISVSVDSGNTQSASERFLNEGRRSFSRIRQVQGVGETGEPDPERVIQPRTPETSSIEYEA